MLAGSRDDDAASSLADETRGDVDGRGGDCGVRRVRGGGGRGVGGGGRDAEGGGRARGGRGAGVAEGVRRCRKRREMGDGTRGDGMPPRRGAGEQHSEQTPIEWKLQRWLKCFWAQAALMKLSGKASCMRGNHPPAPTGYFIFSGGDWTSPSAGRFVISGDISRVALHFFGMND